MQNCYEKTRAKTENIYQEIITHEFVTEVFVKTSKQEWIFWDSAHKQKECKI